MADPNDTRPPEKWTSADIADYLQRCEAFQKRLANYADGKPLDAPRSQRQPASISTVVMIVALIGFTLAGFIIAMLLPEIPHYVPAPGFEPCQGGC